jgi:ATP-dependent Clp protease ATP-binding subunit ClpC
VFERFTDLSRQVLVVAQEEARLLQHSFIGTEHLLLGLAQVDDGVAGQVLREIGVTLSEVRERVQEVVARSGDPAQEGSPPFTPRAKKVLELAFREALQLGAGHIGTEHLLLGLIREGNGTGAQMFDRELSVTSQGRGVRSPRVSGVVQSPDESRPPRLSSSSVRSVVDTRQSRVR